MAEELKELISRIQEEGVKAAEEKAASIEKEARRRAEEIEDRARRDALSLIERAKEEIARAEKGSHESLRQAARDILIGLRKEIAATLDRVVASHVHKVLEPQELAAILSALIKEGSSRRDGDIVVALKKDDLEKLERMFLAELKGELKKGVVLKASDEIRGGFLISYDSGKSYYDFTDNALAKYISTYLKPKLAELLND